MTSNQFQPDLDPHIYTSVDALRRLQYQTRGISFLPRQAVNSLLSGKNVSKLRGRGLNFEELRQYQFGDDIRTMDWKVTQRTGKPYVKVFNEEREREVYLLVDQRQSMFFGSRYKMKSVIAAEVAALIAWSILDATDRIGALIFDDKQSITIKPQRSRQQVVKIIAELVKKNQQLSAQKADQPLSLSLNQMLEKMMQVLGHNALVVLISDGRGWDEKTTAFVKKICQHNEMVICHVTDPLELNIPKMSQMIVSDGQLQIALSSKEVEKQYQQEIEQRLSLLTEITRKYRIPVLPLNTLTDTAEQLRQCLGS